MIYQTAEQQENMILGPCYFVLCTRDPFTSLSTRYRPEAGHLATSGGALTDDRLNTQYLDIWKVKYTLDVWQHSGPLPRYYSVPLVTQTLGPTE